MGGVEFYGIGGLQLGGFVPAAQIGSIGFAFKNYDAVWAGLTPSFTGPSTAP